MNFSQYITESYRHHEITHLQHHTCILLILFWQASFSVLITMSCKQMESHNREPRNELQSAHYWVIQASCNHPLTKSHLYPLDPILTSKLFSAHNWVLIRIFVLPIMVLVHLTRQKQMNFTLLCKQVGHNHKFTYTRTSCSVSSSVHNLCFVVLTQESKLQITQSSECVSYYSKRVA